MFASPRVMPTTSSPGVCGCRCSPGPGTPQAEAACGPAAYRGGLRNMGGPSPPPNHGRSYPRRHAQRAYRRNAPIGETSRRHSSNMIGQALGLQRRKFARTSGRVFRNVEISNFVLDDGKDDYDQRRLMRHTNCAGAPPVERKVTGKDMKNYKFVALNQCVMRWERKGDLCADRRRGEIGNAVSHGVMSLLALLFPFACGLYFCMIRTRFWRRR